MRRKTTQSIAPHEEIQRKKTDGIADPTATTLPREVAEGGEMMTATMLLGARTTTAAHRGRAAMHTTTLTTLTAREEILTILIRVEAVEADGGAESQNLHQPGCVALRQREPSQSARGSGETASGMSGRRDSKTYRRRKPRLPAYSAYPANLAP